MSTKASFLFAGRIAYYNLGEKMIKKSKDNADLSTGTETQEQTGQSKGIALRDENFDLLGDIDQTQEAVKKLLQTKHFLQLGEPGIFAVIQKAKSLKINAFDALQGSLYYLNGKVGMSAEMMNTLIRSNGHSIIKDEKSNNNICILHGKRSDNGDTWTESFSIEDAKRAGIYNERSPWGKYPRNMCFNRALSNLARQLFPDVIKGCYEIDELKSFNEPAQQQISFQKQEIQIEVEEPVVMMSPIQVKILTQALGDDIALQEKILGFLNKIGCASLEMAPAEKFDGLLKYINSQKMTMVSVTKETADVREEKAE